MIFLRNSKILKLLIILIILEKIKLLPKKSAPKLNQIICLDKNKKTIKYIKKIFNKKLCIYFRIFLFNKIEIERK